MFQNFLINESKRNIIKKSKINSAILIKRDILPKYKNIIIEIRKRRNNMRKYLDIKNTIFKEIQSQENSLTYRKFVSDLGKYFFGPNGIVTNKYNFLKSYYEDKNLKIGLNKKIYTGTLDYFYHASPKNSYTKRLNISKEKLFNLSRNLAVPNSDIDKIIQKALYISKFVKNDKNYVKLNIKNAFPAKEKNIKNFRSKHNNFNKKKYIFTYNGINRKNIYQKRALSSSSLITRYVNYSNNSFLSNDNNSNNFINENKKSKIRKTSKNLTSFDFYKKYNFNNEENNKMTKKEKVLISKDKFPFDNQIEKKFHQIFNLNSYIRNNSLNKSKNLSLSKKKLRKAFLEKSKINVSFGNSKKQDNVNSPELKIKKKQYNDLKNKRSLSSFQIKNKDLNINRTKKNIESNSSFNINNILRKKIIPIIYLNHNSQKDLNSYIKHNHFKSKNDKKIKKIIRKKNLESILKDKEYYKNIKKLRTPRINSIKLPKHI